MSERVVEVLRGGWVESVEYADAAVVDSRGRLVAWIGDPGARAFMRSSAKPLQAMPMVRRGAPAALGLSSSDLALLVASHRGEPRQRERVGAILAAIGASTADLILGETGLSHGCSGNHAAMLILAHQLGVSRAGYERPDHPVQRAILAEVRTMCGLRAGSEVPFATDGCGVPTFYLPLARMAYAFARLVDPRGLDADQASAAESVAEAMRRFPEWVSGENTWEARVVAASDHRVIVKPGAEAVVCAGIPEQGWGVAVKLADGSFRALPAVLLAILEALGIRSQPGLGIEELREPVLYDTAGREVGAVRAKAKLRWSRLG